MTDEDPETIEITHLYKVKYDDWGHPYAVDRFAVRSDVRDEDHEWEGYVSGDELPPSVERLILSELGIEIENS